MLRHEVEQEVSSKDKQTGKTSSQQDIDKAVKARFKRAHDHGKLYDKYKKTLQDPDWEAKQRAREGVARKKERAWGAKPGSFKFGLYNLFMVKYK